MLNIAHTHASVVLVHYYMLQNKKISKLIDTHNTV